MKFDVYIEGSGDLSRRLRSWSASMRKEMRSTLVRVGSAWVLQAKRRVPVDTGFLRNSINKEVTVTKTGFELAVGSSAKYACVFDGHTKIVTAAGLKDISTVSIGDLVMTQSGDFRKVLATPRFRAKDKPELVTIKVGWRESGMHTLTLTRDHKVLVHRDGRNQWVEAGTLTTADLLHVRKKLAYNKGSGRIFQTKVCEQCSKEFRPQQVERQRFCSAECYRRSPSVHIGMKRPAMSRERMSDAAKRRLAANPELHPSRIVARRGFVSDCERSLYAWLDDRGIQFSRQHPIGRYVVDAYSDEQRTIYEADGAFWHQDQSVDVARDAELLAAVPGVKIVHLHFFDERFSPRIVSDPLPGVQYVCCNPGPKSYCNLESFDKRPVLFVHHWNYLDLQNGPKDSRRALLYDLTVEGEHSFVASSIVISNSYIEFGTAHIAGGQVKALGTTPNITDASAIKMWPALAKRKGSRQQMPWLRPAWSAIKIDAIAAMNKALEPPKK